MNSPTKNQVTRRPRNAYNALTLQGEIPCLHHQVYKILIIDLLYMSEEREDLYPEDDEDINKEDSEADNPFNDDEDPDDDWDECYDFHENDIDE